MINLVLAHNHFDKTHLDQVVEEMKVKGAPTIRAYDLGFDNLVQAIEGCHRLRACEILGITPVIEYVDADTLCADLEGLDFEGAEYAKEIGDWENYSIEVDE